jgi:hypothetical protein
MAKQPPTEQLAYPGPSDEVIIPLARIRAKRGEPVTIKDPAIRESLIAQGWTVVTAPAAPVEA